MIPLVSLLSDFSINTNKEYKKIQDLQQTKLISLKLITLLQKWVSQKRHKRMIHAAYAWTISNRDRKSRSCPANTYTTVHVWMAGYIGQNNVLFAKPQLYYLIM
jgi:hypothetical protein